MSLTHEELSKKIEVAKEKHNRKTSENNIYGIGSNEASMMGKALRVGTEMVSAILVGGLFGYWIDKIFDIAPFGMTIMMFSGFIASILNIYRMEDNTSSSENKNHKNNNFKGSKNIDA